MSLTAHELSLFTEVLEDAKQSIDLVSIAKVASNGECTKEDIALLEAASNLVKCTIPAYIKKLNDGLNVTTDDEMMPGFNAILAFAMVSKAAAQRLQAIKDKEFAEAHTKKFNDIEDRLDRASDKEFNDIEAELNQDVMDAQ